MELSAEQLAKNFENLLLVVDKYIIGERKDQLKRLYTDVAERMMLAPASNKEHFHNAFPGGYVLHVLNVVKASLMVYNTWKSFGAVVDDFTEEELIFSALNHDLGKIGDLTHDYYIPNESDWHRNNLGLIYNFNPDIPYMNVSDRTFFLLNHYGIKISQNEYLGILLTDGLYEEKNKSYYVSYDAKFALKTNIPHILHHADMLAFRTEYGEWKKTTLESAISKINPQTAPKKAKSNPQVRDEKRKQVFETNTGAKDLKNLFDDVFKD
jgi:hypothetical protein